MSQEPKKVDRRNFIYAGLGAVALIAIGAAAYVAMNPPVVTQTSVITSTVPTTTVITQPTTTVVTTTVPTTSVITTTTATTVTTTSTFKRAEEIVIATHKSPWLNAFKALAEMYTKTTGTKATLMAYNSTTELQEKIFADAMAGAGVHDVILLQYFSAPFLMKGNFLYRILDLQPDFKLDPNVIVPNYCYWPPGSNKLEDLYALPFNANNGFVFYRGDIYKEEGWGPPETWEDLRTYAKKKHNPSNQFYGWIPRADQAWWEWYGCLRSFGGDYFVNWEKGDFTVRVNDQNAVESLEIWSDLAATYGPPSPASVTLSDIISYMSSGKGLQTHCSFAAFSWFDDPLYSSVPMKIESCLVPKGTTPGSKPGAQEGGFTMAIPKGSKKVETAWDFMKFAISYDAQLIFALNGAATCRLDVLDNPSITTNTKFRVFNTFKEALKNMFYFPAIPEMPEIQGSIINPALQDTITKKKTPKEALNEAAQKIVNFLKEKGYKTGLV
ncbi:MAG: extracellular solute-binding protein [Nitrososphaeria archaeon]